jgi:hypothetical protein
VERTAHKLRTTLHRQAQLAAPDRLLVSGLDPSMLQEFASLVSIEASIEVEIVRNASRRLASRLPKLGAVLRALPHQPMPGFRSVSCWDANLTRWRPAPDAGLPGAYQLVGATRTYCLRDADDIAAGTMRRADARLVKHAMALERGETLLAYHCESRTLLMPLGADLPGLYARAAVIASGLRPTESKTERVVGYRDIPADLAEHLVALLSG